MKNLKLKKGDIIILAAVLCVAALAVLCINLYRSEGSTAVVEVDGKTAAVLALNHDTRFEVEIDGNITNTVVIEQGSAYVENADCPDKICQKHNPISKTGESIICLPNKVVITIEGGSEDEIDGVVR